MEDPYQAVLKEQRAQLEKMKTETALLLQMLQIDKETFLKSLDDRSQYTEEEWDSLQRNRKLLSDKIDTAIAKAMEGDTKKNQNEVIQPHWVFVR